MEINKNLLLDIFRIPAPSTGEYEIGRYIKRYLEDLGVPYEEDEMGNIFSFSGAKPLLSAHMDTVQDDADVSLSNFIRIVDNSIIDGLGVIGGDDKCGIYTILHLLTENVYDFNFVFSVEEEIGTNGSGFVTKTKEKELKECLYGIILDRKGSSDIICYNNDYGTIEFERELERVGEAFGFKSTTGVLSDADNFSECISCANLSSGYYQAHSKTEFVIIKHLENTIDFTRAILRDLNVKFDKPVKTVSRYIGRKNYSGGYPSYFDEGLEDYYEELYGGWAMDDDEEFGRELLKPAPTDNCNLCYSNKNLHYVPVLNDFYCETCLAEIENEVNGILIKETV